MTMPSMGKLSFGLLGLAVLGLTVIGPPDTHPVRTAAVPDAPDRPGITAGGITLTSVSADLPADDGQFPAGPHAETINANCTACHSASMVLTQPALSRQQWQAIVEKMQETYKAPVAASDVPAIIDYLTVTSDGKRSERNELTAGIAGETG